jgi:hypothetical protein
MTAKQWVDGVDTLMNKKVISSDLKELGKIVSVDKDSLIILRGDNQYIIPKARVWVMVGNSDVMVDFRLNDLLLVELASLSYIE